MKKNIYLVILRILSVVIIALLLIHIFFLKKEIKILENEKQEHTSLTLDWQTMSEEHINNISTQTDDQTLQSLVQSDNINLLSALSTMANMNRFLPDFMPLRSTYAISQDYSAQHQSIDLSAPRGTAVYAAGAGIVVACYEDKNLGNVILIDHLNSYKTLYAHLDQFKVSINTFIEKEQTIGTVGNTGNSTNPHLHFQIYYENDPIDPNTMMRISKFQN